MLERTTNGIAYQWEIVSSEGAAFILFPESTNTKEEVQKAKAEIRNNRDVVSLRLANENDRDELYRTEIYRQPETKPLHWYEIYETPALIREQRKKGTIPAAYVQQFVLPNINMAGEENFKKYGDKIYRI